MTYEKETRTKTVFENRRKTTSAVTRKRETQTVKLELAVFGFETFLRFLPPVWTDGFENLTRMQGMDQLACSVLYHVTKDYVT